MLNWPSLWGEFNGSLITKTTVVTLKPFWAQKVIGHMWITVVSEQGANYTLQIPIITLKLFPGTINLCLLDWSWPTFVWWLNSQIDRLVLKATNRSCNCRPLFCWHSTKHSPEWVESHTKCDMQGNNISKDTLTTFNFSNTLNLGDAINTIRIMFLCHN